MKKKIFFIIIFQFLFVTIDSYGQDSERFIFEGKFCAKSAQNPTIIDTENKQLHLRSNKAAQITLLYDEVQMNTFHPLAAQIIKQAVGKWEKKIYLPIDKDIRIFFELNDQLANTAYLVDIAYPRINNILYPLPMAIVNHGHTAVNGEAIIITINSESDLWFFEGDGDNPNIGIHQYDFETGMLRALAHCFGFGSTLKNSRPSVGAYFSVFDQFIVNSNNVKFADLSNNNRDEVKEYVTSDNVYWKNGPTAYKLYARSSYDSDLSLKYFDSENELMSHDFIAQAGNRNIDNKVTKIMEDIGWNILLENPLIIKSHNLDDITGLGNANMSYSFYYQSAYAVENPSWKYMIRKKSVVKNSILY